MDITVFISWGNKLYHRGWDVAFCPHCRGLEAMRVEEIIWRFAVYGFPLVRESKGHIERCCLCDRLAQAYFFEPTVRPSDWTPADGFTRLLRALGHQGKVVRRKEPIELRNRSLLDATRDATTMSNMSVLPGLLVGVLLGLLLGCVLSLLAFEWQVIKLGPDRFGAGFIGLLIGAFVGAIIGSCGYWWLRRDSVATRLIRQACQFHQVNPDALVALAPEYPKHVHQAVLLVQLDPGLKQQPSNRASTPLTTDRNAG
jgi:hypothetical protein